MSRRRKLYANGMLIGSPSERYGHGSKRICPKCGRLAYIRFRWCGACMAATATEPRKADAAAVRALAASATVRTFAERVVSGIVSTIRGGGGNG